MSNFMKGGKTYSGLLLTLLGMFGLGNLISSEQIGNLLNSLAQIVGIILAVYGNHKAHREIKALGGYRKNSVY